MTRAAAKNWGKPDLGTVREDLKFAEERLLKQQDLTDRTQNSLEREQQRYKDLFDLAPVGYIVTDRQGIILEANRAATQLLHASLSTLLGKALVSFIPRTGRKTFSAKLSEVSQNGEIQTWDTQLRLSKARRLEVTLQVGVIRYGAKRRRFHGFSRTSPKRDRPRQRYGYSRKRFSRQLKRSVLKSAGNSMMISVKR